MPGVLRECFFSLVCTFGHCHELFHGCGERGGRIWFVVDWVEEEREASCCCFEYFCVPIHVFLDGFEEFGFRLVYSFMSWEKYCHPMLS